MSGSTAAGSSIAIGATAPATYDEAGFTALTLTEVGGVDKIGSLGASFAKVEFQPLKGPKQKYKGSVDYGALQPTYAIDAEDAGQALMETAADDETQKLYPIVVTYPTGQKRCFMGRVFGSPETIDGADTMLMAAPAIEICTKPIKINPAG